MRLNKVERKILVYNKVKAGLTYEQACKEVEREIIHLKELTKKQREEKKKDGNKKF
jgi:hypothetical protein